MPAFSYCPSLGGWQDHLLSQADSLRHDRQCTADSIFQLYHCGSRRSTAMSIKFWTMGSPTRAGWKNIGPIALIVLAAAVFRTQAQTLDGLMLGEEAASTIGINTFRCRLVYLLVLSVLTGALVSVCGTIGFVPRGAESTTC